MTIDGVRYFPAIAVFLKLRNIGEFVIDLFINKALLQKILFYIFNLLVNIDLYPLRLITPSISNNINSQFIVLHALK